MTGKSAAFTACNNYDLSIIDIVFIALSFKKHHQVQVLLFNQNKLCKIIFHYNNLTKNYMMRVKDLRPDTSLT